MKKIVITGGLGYIGTELCRLYSGQSRFKNITVVDRRFSATQVKQLRDWNIDYVQCSILDLDCIKEIVSDADVVIHLAGITDVAYTSTEAIPEKDRLIKEVGIVGTKNIIDNVPFNCKVIFPSTHVVFEGVQDTKKDIIETDSVCPVLSYANTKVQSEFDLQDSDLNYVILRLASVYGYSDNDRMRTNIMPNLFSKIAASNGTIKLFSKGVQLKSLVCIQDVVRFIQFVEEDDQIVRETFHISSDNVSVKEVAEICKAVNPKTTLIETDDEIPNLGYTISNSKILSTGFELQYKLKDEIEKMINHWSRTPTLPGLETIQPGQKEYVDDRGKISNYELTEPINLVGMITSKKGVVRANHYHPIQEQKCLLVTGQYISVLQDLSQPNLPVETNLINAGDLAIIKPNVAHTMVFTQDSTFLNLVRGEREHENYGITHTIPYKLVDNEFRNQLLSTYKTTCRSCNNSYLKKVVSLGLMPLANNLCNDQDEYIDKHLLELNYCDVCNNCQLSVVVPAKTMFDHYLYVSSTSPVFVKHFEDAAEKYIQDFKLTPKDLVIDIGSNDGIALKPFQKRGIKVLGIEPATNIQQIADKNGVPTINAYCTVEKAIEIVKYHGKAKVVTASNVFAHADDLHEIAAAASYMLEDDGVFIIEVQYLLSTIQDLTFDNIYHEHTNYWSVNSLYNFFDRVGLRLYKVERINTHGGSIRAYVQRQSQYGYNSFYGETIIHPSVNELLELEDEFGLTSYDRYQEFGEELQTIKNNVRKNFDILKQKYSVIAGYGAPAKATTALNFFGLTNEDINYVIEDNVLKHNKFIPGTKIPIVNKNNMPDNPQAIIVLAWNFFDSIVAKNQDLVKDYNIEFINIRSLGIKQYDYTAIY